VPRRRAEAGARDAVQWQHRLMSDAGGRYTHGHHDSVLRSHRWRTAENSAGYLLPLLRPGMTLLDVGCGPGTLTVDLAARVAPGAVVGLDIAGAVLEEAGVHARERHVDNVAFVQGDIRTARLDPARFDVVHAHQVLQFLADPVDALRAMGRMTVDGGVVAVREGDWATMAWAPDDPRLDRWLALYRSVMVRNGGDPTAGRRLPGWARSAGLRVDSFTTSTWTYATSAERAWWGGLWADRVRSSGFAGQAVAYGVADEDELRDIARAWRDWAREPDAVFVVTHGELIARPDG
jgi:SAM-dependent methyltransferase